VAVSTVTWASISSPPVLGRISKAPSASTTPAGMVTQLRIRAAGADLEGALGLDDAGGDGDAVADPRQRRQLGGQTPGEGLHLAAGALDLDGRAAGIVQDEPGQPHRSGQTVHVRAESHPLDLPGHVHPNAL